MLPVRLWGAGLRQLGDRGLHTGGGIGAHLQRNQMKPIDPARTPPLCTGCGHQARRRGRTEQPWPPRRHPGQPRTEVNTQLRGLRRAVAWGALLPSPSTSPGALSSCPSPSGLTHPHLVAQKPWVQAGRRGGPRGRDWLGPRPPVIPVACRGEDGSCTWSQLSSPSNMGTVAQGALTVGPAAPPSQVGAGGEAPPTPASGSDERPEEQSPPPFISLLGRCHHLCKDSACLS